MDAETLAEIILSVQAQVAAGVCCSCRGWCPAAVQVTSPIVRLLVKATLHSLGKASKSAPPGSIICVSA